MTEVLLPGGESLLSLTGWWPEQWTVRSCSRPGPGTSHYDGVHRVFCSQGSGALDVIVFFNLLNPWVYSTIQGTGALNAFYYIIDRDPGCILCLNGPDLGCFLLFKVLGPWICFFI